MLVPFIAGNEVHMRKGRSGLLAPLGIWVFWTLIAVLVAASSEATSQVRQLADELVQQLGQFPAAIPAVAPSTGVPSHAERLRRDLYDQLWTLGPTAVPALCRGLGDPDPQVRRNVALFLGLAGGDWYDRERPRLRITECVPALVVALRDADDRVRELAAQAVGATGADGVSAVPALIGMLGSASDGDRNSACIGLAGIGPVAKGALPALQHALADQSPDVRGFAKRAIERIQR